MAAVRRHIFKLTAFSSTTSFSTTAFPQYPTKPPFQYHITNQLFKLEHLIVVLKPLFNNIRRKELIEYYNYVLSKACGSEAEARDKLYAVSTRWHHYFHCFGSAELSHRIAALDEVDVVFPWNFNNFPFLHKTYKGNIFLNGCDFKHWLVRVKAPVESMNHDEIICGYVKLLTEVVGCESDAKKRIYSVSTVNYYRFSCEISKEMSFELEEVDGVLGVLPDFYWNEKEEYGDEPFIHGKVVPPKLVYNEKQGMF